MPITYSVWWTMASIDRDLNPPTAPIDPRPFHTLNVIIHAMTALLIAAIVRRILGSDWPAIGAGLLFALHPLQVETIAWASGTKDLLAAFFGAWTIWLYLLASPDNSDERRNRILDTVALGTFALAVLSKPSAMTIPAMLVVHDRLFAKRCWRAIALSIWPFAIFSAVAMTIA